MDVLSAGVVVRCGYCGELQCFFPCKVLHLGDCRCGNNNWGSPNRDWPRSSFGDFDLVWTFSIAARTGFRQ